MDDTSLAIQSLAKQFDIELRPGSEIAPGGADYAEIKAILGERILYLLKNDHSSLFNILYRIDVNETLVKEALDTVFLQEAAERIAELVIKRQVQKYLYRKSQS